jgi:glycerol uptake facilitator-like aquaporin
MVMTFMFVTFVLVIVKHNGSSDMPINAACIGMALYVAAREASGVSGGCINPAIGLVQSVMQRTVNAKVYPNAGLMHPPETPLASLAATYKAIPMQAALIGISEDPLCLTMTRTNVTNMNVMTISMQNTLAKIAP